ncbi:hypothetical protein C8J57DRAFT_1256360 [Mycena rebaudengoi]|nr:hypothetical protein C8J57DRAFT_1256360 [Mycena rebaudengoi]
MKHPKPESRRPAVVRRAESYTQRMKKISYEPATSCRLVDSRSPARLRVIGFSKVRKHYNGGERIGMPDSNENGVRAMYFVHTTNDTMMPNLYSTSYVSVGLSGTVDSLNALLAGVQWAVVPGRGAQPEGGVARNCHAIGEKPALVFINTHYFCAPLEDVVAGTPSSREHLGIERTGVIEARRRSGVHGGNGGIKVMASGVKRDAGGGALDRHGSSRRSSPYNSGSMLTVRKKRKKEGEIVECGGRGKGGMASTVRRRSLIQPPICAVILPPCAVAGSPNSQTFTSSRSNVFGMKKKMKSHPTSNSTAVNG